MLFNSFEFILFFMPITVAGYFLLCRVKSVEWGLAFLLLASLFFYAYWNPIYVLLIASSIVGNFVLGESIGRYQGAEKRLLLILGLSLNLSLLGYYKYFNFFIDNINILTNVDWRVDSIVLPLAISFFTFQQISYLVDAYRNETHEYNFLHYAFFVSFFPQLIAGPIVHHKEMMPQFFNKQNMIPKLNNFAVGISIFAIGLFKKTVIADSLSKYVGPVYESHANVDLILAWGSTLAYTFQLYFDFSGYSDMAVGCARIFGIKLPVNFFSPYKAKNIVEFWRRWHITLSRFLRDYLYIALGGNRYGIIYRYRNLFLTMLLGGLWHGAGWTFVIWGALHGGYMVIQHGWRWLLRHFKLNTTSLLYELSAWLITFLSVVFAWVYFRAPDLERANEIVQGLLGMNGVYLPSGILTRLGEWQAILYTLGIQVGMGSGSQIMFNSIWVFIAAVIAFSLPNCAQIFSKNNIVLYEKPSLFPAQNQMINLSWKLNGRWSFVIAALLGSGLLTLGQVSEFLYFQF